MLMKQARFLESFKNLPSIFLRNNSTTLFPIPIELFRPFLEPGEPASEEARARALQYAAETIVDALPKEGDRAAIEAAARKMVGVGRAAPDKERVPASRDDADDEARG